MGPLMRSKQRSSASARLLQSRSDLEKDAVDRYDASDDSWEDDSSPSYSHPSSRATSDSHLPMLHKSFVRSQSASNHRTSIYAFRLPNKVTRCLFLTLTSTIILLIIFLVQMSWSSSKKVAEATTPEKPPPPPQWESFEFLKRYYGGIRTLTLKKENVAEYPYFEEDRQSLSANATAETVYDVKNVTSSSTFNPYPEYGSKGYRTKYVAVKKCYLDENNTIEVPLLHYYNGIPGGFPDAVMGSSGLLGIREDICFDRYGRLGPYGLGYSLNRGGTGTSVSGDREGAEEVWEHSPPIDYRGINWADAQKRCTAANKKRFSSSAKQDEEEKFLSMKTSVDRRQLDDLSDHMTSKNASGSDNIANTNAKELLPRTAFVIRTWWDYDYKVEDIMYLRSLVSELSLLSGGEYTVHFLIHVKDDNLPIWSDSETYERTLRNSLPEEFRGMGTLWSERQMGLLYGGLEESFYRDLPVHGVYRSSFMPLQYFAHKHPEYSHFWNWEMDARYTGNWYDFFTHITQWAKAQPRKGLWERNARFYVPSVHGTWQEFSQRVKFQTEEGTNSPNNVWSHAKPGSDVQGDKFVWGPESPINATLPEDMDVYPPTSQEKDDYVWGVDEEADLITFNPLFDPASTTWLLADDTTGYDRALPKPPRRAAIITAGRMSRRLLETMHEEVALYRHSMFSEMFPATICLHHGFKAVYAPHSVYIDRDWPVSYLAAVFNGGRNGASGGARTSVFGDREHNFRGTTWYYNAGFGPNLYRRWLGYKVDGDGGEEEEVTGEGRMCLPPVLLHPIKDVQMVQEGLMGE